MKHLLSIIFVIFEFGNIAEYKNAETWKFKIADPVWRIQEIKCYQIVMNLL